MKKIILTALLLGLLYNFGLCQGPTLYNYNIVPKANERHSSELVDTTGVTSNLTGANCIWDYSNLNVVPDETSLFQYVTPTTTPYLSFFPNANIAEKYSSNSKYFYGRSNCYAFLGIHISTVLVVQRA